MEIKIAREAAQANAVFGVLSLDGAPWCFTLEREDVMIPVGRYRIALTASGRAERMELWSPFPPSLPEILAVPDRTGIRIHSGNTIDDTAGCLLVGLGRESVRAIYQSHLALTELMKMMRAGETWIELVAAT